MGVVAWIALLALIYSAWIGGTWIGKADFNRFQEGYPELIGFTAIFVAYLYLSYRLIRNHL
jgi:predicted branched-subunit amino acid permease